MYHKYLLNMKFSNNSIHPRNIFRAFRYRNYRLYFGGQGISLIGTWMQRIAMGWLVYRLTNSMFLLGFVGFLSALPMLFITPFAGVLVDRINRFQIVLWMQILATIQALILWLLVFTNTIQIWQIIVLSIFLGLVNAFDMPARQSFVVEMVDKKEDLGNAIALNSTMFNGARLIGPTVAGILIASTGEGVCFLVNAITFFAVIIGLLLMKIKEHKIEPQKSHIFKEMQQGFHYTFSFMPIRSIILLLTLISIMGMPYAVLMPVFAGQILHGGPQTLGFLMASAGVGAIIGALYLASKKTVFGLDRIIPISAGIFGIGIITFAISRMFLLSALFMTLVGFGMMVQMASSNTVVQTIIDDDKRGRVMSFYTMAFIGTAPFGSLLAGSVASKIGAPNTLIICGSFCILGALIFIKELPEIHKLIRPIYIKMGIIPEVASGIQTASQLTTPPED